MPLVERLPELTPRHRVVVELSELQLPTLSRGTDVAVYHPRHERPPRPPRHARGVPRCQAPPGRAAAGRRAAGAQCRGSGFSPSSSTPPTRPPVFYRRGEPAARRRRRASTAGSSAATCASSTRGRRRDDRTGRPDHAASTRSRCPASTTSATSWRQLPLACCSALRRTRIRRAVGEFRRRRASTRTRRQRRRRAVRQRLAGHAARCGHRRAAQLRTADRADLRRPLKERAHRCARARSCAARGRGDRHRRDRRRVRGRFTRRRRRAHRIARAISSRRCDWRDATARALGGGTVLLSPAATSFDMFVDYAARGTAFKEIVHKVAAEHARGGLRVERHDQARRRHAAQREPTAATPRTSRPPHRSFAGRSASATSRTGSCSLAVVALAALGILMVYSSTGATRRARPGSVRDRWAAGAVGRARRRRDARRDAHRLPLPAPRVGWPASSSRSACWSSSPSPASDRSARSTPIAPLRWLQIGPLPAMHPAEFAKLALVVYLAHWLAKRGSRTIELHTRACCRSC